jgi:hypothetical protein
MAALPTADDGFSKFSMAVRPHNHQIIRPFFGGCNDLFDRGLIHMIDGNDSLKPDILVEKK